MCLNRFRELLISLYVQSGPTAGGISVSQLAYHIPTDVTGVYQELFLVFCPPCLSQQAQNVHKFESRQGKTAALKSSTSMETAQSWLDIKRTQNV